VSADGQAPSSVDRAAPPRHAEEIARTVVFFVSDDAAYITGQTISVDGGQWMLG
jgi:NAD(P)-dependent dehydrogenase (short-subunit alcohol dehydrogenase family)